MTEAASRKRVARLVILSGASAGTIYELHAEETMIGRNSTNDVQLLDEGISREHAMLLADKEDGVYVIEDLQSTNGTKVNGTRVFSTELSDGDEVEVGVTRLRFEFMPR